MRFSNQKEKQHFTTGVVVLSISFLLSITLSLFLYYSFFFYGKDLSRFLPEKTSLFFEIDLENEIVTRNREKLDNFIKEQGFELRSAFISDGISRGAFAIVLFREKQEQVFIFQVKDVEAANKFLRDIPNDSYQKSRLASLSTPVSAGGKIEHKDDELKSFYFIFTKNTIFLSKSEELLGQIEEISVSEEAGLYRKDFYQKTLGSSGSLFRIFLQKEQLQNMDAFIGNPAFEYASKALLLAKGDNIGIEGSFCETGQEVCFTISGLEPEIESQQIELDSKIVSYIPHDADFIVFSESIRESFGFLESYEKDSDFVQNKYQFFKNDFYDLFGYQFEEEILSLFEEGVIFSLNQTDFEGVFKIKDNHDKVRETIENYIITSYLIKNPEKREIVLSDGTKGHEYIAESQEISFYKDESNGFNKLRKKDQEVDFGETYMYKIRDNYLVISGYSDVTPELLCSEEIAVSLHDQVILDERLYPFIYIDLSDVFPNVRSMVIFEPKDREAFGKFYLR